MTIKRRDSLDDVLKVLAKLPPELQKELLRRLPAIERRAKMKLIRKGDSK